MTSRWPDFHRLPIGKRLRETARRFGLSPRDVAALRGGAAAGSAFADRMIENAIGTFGMPIGLGLNLVVNGQVVKAEDRATVERIYQTVKFGFKN